MEKKHRGQRAEQIAAEWLQDQWMRICDRNRTMRGGELDIVGYMDDLLVVVEVKSIDTLDDLHGYLSPTKLRHVIHTTMHRIQTHHWTWPFRIDVLFVVQDRVVERYKNVTNT